MNVPKEQAAFGIVSLEKACEVPLVEVCLIPAVKGPWDLSEQDHSAGSNWWWCRLVIKRIAIRPCRNVQRCASSRFHII
jgi:hypothetical protein